jgi:prepilin-type N-terminal cleavage/methylation domain-containing protein
MQLKKTTPAAHFYTCNVKESPVKAGHSQCIAPDQGEQGYTLVEVIVVMVIVGILATGVVFMFANPSARVRGQAFTMLGELNQARSEAVNRNIDVRVTFLPGAAATDEDGYRIWIDDWDAGGGGPGSDGAYTAGSDTLILETFFPLAVQFYDKNGTGGPGVDPDGGGLNMENGDSDDDGIEFDGADEFVFTARGIAEDSGSATLDNTGFVYIYLPASPADHTTMRAAPYGLVVTTGTGRVRIARWDTSDAAWRTK